MLIGGNNSGKSSIPQAIQFAVSAAQTTSTQNAYWKENRLSTSVSPSDLIYSPLKDVYALAPFGRLKEAEGQSISIKFEVGTASCLVEVKKGRNKNIVITLVGEELGRLLESLENPYSIIVPGLAGIPSMEEYETPLVVRKAAARGDSNRVFRNILWLLKQDRHRWEEFTSRLTTIFPGIELRIEFNPESQEHISCSVEYDDYNLPIDSCGTGVLQAIQILSYISLYHPQILILDEPDSHLHPNNQRRLCRMLQDLTRESDLKIIISTHSLHMVDALHQEAVIHWIRNGIIVDGVDDYELKALVDIGALNEGARLREARFLILTEDEGKILIENLLIGSGYDISECDIWSYKGCANVQTAKALISYARKRNPDCIVIIHRDRDCLTEPEIASYKARYSEPNVYVFVPEYCDLESFYGLPTHIHALAPTISLERAEALYHEVIEERFDRLLENFINSKIDYLRKTSQGNINFGELAVTSRATLETSSRIHANGKMVIAGLHEKLRQVTGGNINLLRHTEVLRSQELESILQQLRQIQLALPLDGGNDNGTSTSV